MRENGLSKKGNAMFLYNCGRYWRNILIIQLKGIRIFYNIFIF